MYKKQAVSTSEAKSKLSNIKVNLKAYLDFVGDELENVSWNREDPEENFMRGQIYSISSHLESALNAIQYLEKDISAEGELYLNSQGRYEINDSVYLTSGSGCELLIYDDFDENYSWLKTTIEHNGENYYAVALGREVSIDGVRARVRR